MKNNASLSKELSISFIRIFVRCLQTVNEKDKWQQNTQVNVSMLMALFVFDICGTDIFY